MAIINFFFGNPGPCISTFPTTVFVPTLFNIFPLGIKFFTTREAILLHGGSFSFPCTFAGAKSAISFLDNTRPCEELLTACSADSFDFHLQITPLDVYLG